MTPPPPHGARAAIARQLFRLAAPIIGLNVLNVLALAVDTAMCGRLPDHDTVLTGLGFAVQVIFLLLVAMMGLTVGTVALVSRAYGARDEARVNHLLVQSTQLTVGISVAVAITGNLLAGPLLRLLGAEPPVVEAGLEYLRPILAGTVFYYLTILYGGVLRGVGNTMLPFLVALGSNVLNFLLNYGLILGNFGLPSLGLRGAAIGTVTAYAVGVAVTITLLRRDVVPGLRLSLRPRRIDGGLARQLFRVGAPAALDMVILNVGFVAIIGMLARIDQVAVAAHAIGLRIQALAFVPGLSVSQATAALVGQALGASDVPRARHVAVASVWLCTAIMSLLAICIIAAAHPLVSLFDVPSGTELEGYAVTWMKVLGYGMPIFGVHLAMVGLLQGAGATRTSLEINLASTLLVQIPLGAALAFPLGLGALGLWLSFPISFAIKAALASFAYRRGRWARVGAGV